MTILVIDIGSSSIRALLFDEAAQPIPGVHISVPHQLITLADGTAILTPLALKQAVESCLDAAVQSAEATTIQAVIMATLVGNVMGVDLHNAPTTPLYTYADTRSAHDVDLLAAQIDSQSAHQRTGCRLHTAYLPARLHWLKRTQPDLFATTARWIDLGTYLYTCWFGDSSCSYSVAAWSGMLNRALLEWDAEWLHILGISPTCLPRLSDYDAPVRGLLPDYAKRWTVLHDIPFFLALGDGAAANIGSGCVDSKHIALTLGTTGALRTVFSGDAPPVPDGLWSYRISAPLHLIGGATSEGGNIAAWLHQIFQLDGEALNAALRNAEPDAHGLTVLPLFVGERSPGWNANAVGTLHGLRLSTTSLEIAQAALESVALRLAAIHEQLVGIAQADALVIGGGGALTHSPVWVQMIADALNRPLHLSSATEITARGAAILALHALGIGSLDVLASLEPQMTTIIEPRTHAAAKMKAARERQQDLYERLYR